MTLRERFHAIMSFQPCDCVPCWFFGTWRETKQRWRDEGCAAVLTVQGDAGPQLPSMDREWEPGMWDIHGIVQPWPISGRPNVTVEETDAYRVVRDSLGGLAKHAKGRSSIPESLEYPLEPTRESWREFKRFLDPEDPRRRPADWHDRAAAVRAGGKRAHVAPFFAGSLFGYPRDWMGVEQLCFLAHDDPALLEEILEHLVTFYITVLGPVLPEAEFDFAYIFEDCCYSAGPLLSPDLYKRFYARHYRRLIDFYHAAGVPWVLLDSDGRIDQLAPLWLESGVDILFPIEVGTWNADPIDLRQRFGSRRRMMGGINKHLIPRGERALRDELRRIRPAVEAGGFIPLPDHRIPPDCSWQQFETYVRVFKEELWHGAAGQTSAQ